MEMLSTYSHFPIENLRKFPSIVLCNSILNDMKNCNAVTLYVTSNEGFFCLQWIIFVILYRVFPNIFMFL
jgi:hypothetical protein